MKKREFDMMPDVTNSVKTKIESKLNWVGMGDVQSCMLIPASWTLGDKTLESKQPLFLQGKSEIFVDLADPQAKGIHMSRLFLALSNHLESVPLNDEIFKLLDSLVQSQEGISLNSQIKLKFALPLKRKALLSETSGWRHYPIVYTFTNIDGVKTTQLEFEVTYSSTCPCSAALSRQLIQKNWLEAHSKVDTVKVSDVADWLGKKESMIATPHAQRSFAKVCLVKKGEKLLIPLKYINQVESALQTPVQTAVKRIDEQEFARLNGTNLMFCEDAVRRVQKSLKSSQDYSEYKIRVEHVESLHAHSAVAEVFGSTI